jgi:hypothetical protein
MSKLDDLQKQIKNLERVQDVYFIVLFCLILFLFFGLFIKFHGGI